MIKCTLKGVCHMDAFFFIDSKSSRLLADLKYAKKKKLSICELKVGIVIAQWANKLVFLFNMLKGDLMSLFHCRNSKWNWKFSTTNCPILSHSNNLIKACCLHFVYILFFNVRNSIRTPSKMLGWFIIYGWNANETPFRHFLQRLQMIFWMRKWLIRFRRFN